VHGVKYPICYKIANKDLIFMYLYLFSPFFLFAIKAAFYIIFITDDNKHNIT